MPSTHSSIFPVARRLAPLALLAALGVARSAGAEDSADIAALSLERLLDVEVVSASKFAQKISDAPGRVTVVTAADIRTFGYRKLSDILASIPGLYVSTDRNYEYLGVRGVRRFLDYSSRILLLLDGNRMNDTVYGTATIGTEFILDVDLIDRVEFVPGPGSSVYGSNAFFGVINVITKTGRDYRHGEAAVAFGDFGTRAGRFTYGHHTADGLDIVASATLSDQYGQDLRVTDVYADDTHAPVAHHMDYDRHYSGFLKGTYGGLTVESAYSFRRKGIATGMYNCVFDVPGCYTEDIQGMLQVDYRRSAGRNDFEVRAYYDHYPYTGIYPYLSGPGGPVVDNRDAARSDWWGFEGKLLSRHFDRHIIVLGAEYRRDVHEDSVNYDIQPYTSYFDSRHASSVRSVYAQDEFTLSPKWTVSAGLRRDLYESFGGITTPRLALIHHVSVDDRFKLIYGQAFRAPNASDLYLFQPNVQKGNPDLKPERIRITEAVFEHDLDTRTRLAASLYTYAIDDVIEPYVDPVDGLQTTRNNSTIKARGLEVSLDHGSAEGTKVRASWSWQHAEEAVTGAPLTDSPRYLIKLAGAMPTGVLGLRAGVEAHYTSRRLSNLGAAGGYALVDATLTRTFAHGLEISVSAYNLLDRKYGDPGSADLSALGLDVLRMDGRSLLARALWRF